MGWIKLFFGIKDEPAYRSRPREERDREYTHKREDPIFSPKETTCVENYKRDHNDPISFNNRSDKRQDVLEFRRTAVIKEKDVVIIVIENSIYTRGYKADILQLINKIIELNKDCFFLLTKIGDNKKTYNVLNYESIKKKEIFNDLFDEGTDSTCDYLEALKSVEEFYRSTIGSFEFEDNTEEKVKKYSIQNVNIVFVGSGNVPEDEENKKECIKVLKTIKEKMRVKTIKYFCMLDKQTQNAAKLGFPVIGHIETDFYK